VRLLDGTTARLSAIDLDMGPGHAFDDRVVLIADDGCGRMIGRAAFGRVYGPRAVLELEVDPALWHFGLPAILLERLCARAARAGIVALIARVPAAQVELLALLRAEFGARGTCEGAYVDVEFSTSVPGPERCI
jgi:GNAT superfamily N-acetyltransferase